MAKPSDDSSSRTCGRENDVDGEVGFGSDEEEVELNDLNQHISKKSNFAVTLPRPIMPCPSDVSATADLLFGISGAKFNEE